MIKVSCGVSACEWPPFFSVFFFSLLQFPHWDGSAEHAGSRRERLSTPVGAVLSRSRPFVIEAGPCASASLRPAVRCYLHLCMTYLSSPLSLITLPLSAPLQARRPRAWTCYLVCLSLSCTVPALFDPSPAAEPFLQILPRYTNHSVSSPPSPSASASPAAAALTTQP